MNWLKVGDWTFREDQIIAIKEMGKAAGTLGPNTPSTEVVLSGGERIAFWGPDREVFLAYMKSWTVADLNESLSV